MWTVNTLRQAYLDFFTDLARGHVVIPSAALVPENDPTTLFTSSGMQPLVPYLLGQSHPKGTRLVDSQKTFRAVDIEEVGDNRHTTFFEMLGNWSLGEYFKTEQLEWFFTFLTDVVQLPPDRLFVTVFRGNEELGIPKDTESVAIWQKLFKAKGIDAKDVDFADRDGMQGGRIFYYEEKKNWWSRSGVPAAMPAGEPGGPDSEVFYDFGADLQLHEQSAWKDEPCHVNCDCGRFMEIGNSVFMQYQKQADGSFQELPQRNVDFGGGLERILAAAYNTQDVFETPAFADTIQTITADTKAEYNQAEYQPAIRVIADHLRAATMLIVDGVRPSNKQQGYVLRRLIRRAAVKNQALGGDFTPIKTFQSIAKQVIEQYAEVDERLGFGVEVERDVPIVQEVLATELTKFGATLDRGLKKINHAGEADLTEQFAFDLFQSYGFPFEITQELFKERGVVLDEVKFKEIYRHHQDASRSASAGTFKGGLSDSSEITTKYHTATHLLQAALRKVLGKHVQQKGSNITAERLRFDFTHHQAMTEAELQAVEKQINDWIAADLPVTKQIMPKQQALESGAIAFFVEKYPDEVSVYTVGRDPETDWVSKELCGGPHVSNTGTIGAIKLTKEQAVSAGVRRLYAELA